MMVKLRGILLFCAIFWLCCSQLFAGPQTLFLRDNLKKAKPGDFIVTLQNKAYTLMHIHAKADETLTIEEITAPEKKIIGAANWPTWVEQGAPGNTSWVIYQINLGNGTMSHYYSFSKNGWYSIPEADNFLTTLLNLRLEKLADVERKKIGTRPPKTVADRRPLWHPKLIMNGQQVQGVPFDAYRTTWPKDGSDLAGKLIEVYVPQENELYPSYFPYWLQISGFIGNAKVRIVDSGTGLMSPRQYPQ